MLRKLNYNARAFLFSNFPERVILDLWQPKNIQTQKAVKATICRRVVYAFKRIYNTDIFIYVL